MFWNKKDSKDSLPDLPPLKTPLRSPIDMPKRDPFADISASPSPEPPSEGESPSIPPVSLPKQFSSEEIRSALSHPRPAGEDEPIVQGESSRIKTMEMDSPPLPPMAQKPFRLDNPPEENSYVPPRRPSQKVSDVFVKIERFNSAHRSVVGIRKKIEEIDLALKRIREIKMREEQELAAWEKEISSLKSRLQEVNDALFE